MSENLKRIFADNLRHYLELSGYTQADLARKLGVSSATASDWCNGNKMPRSDKLQTICNWLGIELQDILTEDGKKKEYYLDPETAKAAQDIFEDSNMRILFDAAKGSRPEDLRMAADFLKRLKETNPDG